MPQWALQFLNAHCQSASSAILGELRQLPKAHQRRMVAQALRLLHDPVLVRHKELRSGAGRVIVAKLPGTFAILREILANFRLPHWYEIHFLVFSALDRSDLSERNQELVLGLVESYLMSVRSEAGLAAWKAGDMLGDEWNSPATVAMLEKLVTSARYAAGRKGAIHGLAHALDRAKPLQEQRLLEVLGKVALEDRSAGVQSDADFVLSGFGCYKPTYRHARR